MFRSMLIRWLRPDIVADSLAGIDLKSLRDRGIAALLLDLDNTLVLWGSREVRPEVCAWVQRALEMGFRLCIVSNTGRVSRVEPVARRLGIPFTIRAVKPSRRAFRKAAEMLGVTPGEATVIGDQVFTDVLGGKRAGMLAILVAPLDMRREFVSTRVMRLVERAVWSCIRPDPCGAEGQPSGGGDNAGLE